MPDLVQVKRALISVSDKSDIVTFARSLASMGIEIISTGGTAAALQAGGIATTTVEDVTGFPEMMDGRVKTLHPVIHGALLARRDEPSHMAALSALAVPPVEIICVPISSNARAKGMRSRLSLTEIRARLMETRFMSVL